MPQPIGRSRIGHIRSHKGSGIRVWVVLGCWGFRRPRSLFGRGATGGLQETFPIWRARRRICAFLPNSTKRLGGNGGQGLKDSSLISEAMSSQWTARALEPWARLTTRTPNFSTAASPASSASFTLNATVGAAMAAAFRASDSAMTRLIVPVWLRGAAFRGSHTVPLLGSTM